MAIPSRYLRFERTSAALEESEQEHEEGQFLQHVKPLTAFSKMKVSYERE
jgi:hypothetical protein